MSTPPSRGAGESGVGSGVDFIARLPAEVVRRVLSRLPGPNLARLRLVSASWRAARDDDALWAGVYDRAYGDAAAEWLAAVSLGDEPPPGARPRGDERLDAAVSAAEGRAGAPRGVETAVRRATRGVAGAKQSLAGARAATRYAAGRERPRPAAPRGRQQPGAERGELLLGKVRRGEEGPRAIGRRRRRAM